MKPFIFAGIAALACLCGCHKDGSFSEIPEVKFDALEMRTASADKLGMRLKEVKLSFSFVDGDGDLGIISYADNAKSYILYSWMAKQSGGSYEAYIFPSGATEDTLGIPYRDVMNREEAYNKTLKGKMDVRLTVPYGAAAVGMDSVYISFYITDRASHQSNIEITPRFSVLADSVTLTSPK